MDAINTVDLSGFLNIISLMTQYWYISLLLGFGLLVGNRWFPQIVIFMISFFLGMFYLFPVIKELDMVKTWMLENPSWEFPVSLGAGFVVAFVGYAFFRFLFFLGGFLAGGALGLWLWNIFSPLIHQHWGEHLEQMPWAIWIFAAILGLVVGILVFVSQEKTVSLVSIFLGSMILSILTLWALMQLQPQWFGSIEAEPHWILEWKPAGIAVFFGTFVVFAIFGFGVGRKKRVRVQA